MKVTLKDGNSYKTKVGLDIKVVLGQIENLLKHNNNLCLSCDKVACAGIIDIQNTIVQKGIRTKKQDYVLECTGYEQIQRETENGYNAGKEYRLNHPVVR